MHEATPGDASGSGDPAEVNSGVEVGRPDAAAVRPTGEVPEVQAAAGVALSSLAPSFSAEQHQSYLDRLNKALEDPRNRNIALTGRYGAGKSSVLDEFERTHKAKGRRPKPRVLRLAISSLSPNDEGASLTNLIQKEIVKQLIYSAKPSTLDRSQFRPAELGRWKAAGQVAGVLACVAVVLVLMGWLPTPSLAKSGEPWGQRALVWAALAAVLQVAGTTLRLLTHQKFFASEFSAAGAKVKLSEKKLTYFDEYLDLIVNFFDSENIDVVIFEDLDRFNDPYIFEALRELNTLLNGRGRGKRRSGELRFVYAVRDSLFERIGSKPKVEVVPDTAGGTQSTMTADRPGLPAPADAASVETARANRTKFFEVVIPVVPFISHRNARDLLVDLLDEAGIAGIRRGLVDLVARHCTDMRLLRNMRNEYLVFAERLLEGKKQAPGLTPTKLFALVAYKNFHLEDFENIARRSSALDTLYDDRRALVRQCVAEREQEIRDVRRTVVRPGAAAIAHRCGTRLNAFGQLQIEHNGWSGWHLAYAVDTKRYSEQDALTPTFWDAVSEAGAASLQAGTSARSSSLQSLFELSQQQLEALLPEVAGGRWVERNKVTASDEVDRLTAEITFLRGADFDDLVGHDKYKMLPRTAASPSLPETTTSDGDAVAVPFSKRVKEVLASELSRDLIRNGFIDQNYSVYAAQFYGDFAGVDVHRFLIQAEQPNTPEIDFKFDSESSVEQLLTEASSDFTESVAAFNTDVLDWLLSHAHAGARHVVNHATRTFETSDDARQLLATYFTSGHERSRLAALLAREQWRTTFTHLVTSADVPEDKRADLADAALRAMSASDVGAYDTPDEVANFLLDHYQQMPAFTEPQSTQVAAAVVAFVKRADVLLPDLAGLDSGVRDQVVEADLYELTAHNLRLAAGLRGTVRLDHLREVSPDVVYGQCLRHLDTYLAAVAVDSATGHAIASTETLVDVLNTAASADWPSAQQAALFDATSSAAALSDVRAVPSTTWKALATAGLFHATLGNIGTYLAEIGDIDAALGSLLTTADSIDPESASATSESGESGESEATPAADARTVAVAVLTAREAIPSTEHRVRLASSLEFDRPLAATEVAAERSDLFAHLLRAGLVADDQATFDHLATGGWPAVRAAIVASQQVGTLLTPAHVSGLIEDVLDDPEAAKKVGGRILEDLDSFVAADDRMAWTSVADYAIGTRHVLSWPHLQQVAGHSAGSPQRTMDLLVVAKPGPEDRSEVLVVLASLGAPWSYLSTREHTEFEAPAQAPFAAVLELLKSLNVVKLGRPKKDGNRTVTVL